MRSPTCLFVRTDVDIRKALYSIASSGGTFVQSFTESEADFHNNLYSNVVHFFAVRWISTAGSGSSSAAASSAGASSSGASSSAGAAAASSPPSLLPHTTDANSQPTIEEIP